MRAAVLDLSTFSPGKGAGTMPRGSGSHHPCLGDSEVWPQLQPGLPSPPPSLPAFHEAHLGLTEG